jgi:hypothetical protein
VAAWYKACGSDASHMLELCVIISPGGRGFCLLNIVCFQVEVSVMGRSLIQGGPTECVCVINCDQVQKQLSTLAIIR